MCREVYLEGTEPAHKQKDSTLRLHDEIREDIRIKTDSLVQAYAGFICDKAFVSGAVFRDILNLCITPPPPPPSSPPHLPSPTPSTSSIVLWPDYRPHHHCSQGYKITIFMWWRAQPPT